MMDAFGVRNIIAAIPLQRDLVLAEHGVWRSGASPKFADLDIVLQQIDLPQAKSDHALALGYRPKFPWILAADSRSGNPFVPGDYIYIHDVASDDGRTSHRAKHASFSRAPGPERFEQGIWFPFH